MVRCCSQRMQNNALEPVQLLGRQTAGPPSRTPSDSSARPAPGADLLAQPPQHLCRAPRHTPHFQLLCSFRKRSRACPGWQQAGRAQAGAGPQPRLHPRQGRPGLPHAPRMAPAAPGPGPGPRLPNPPPPLHSRPHRLAPDPGPPRRPVPARRRAVALRDGGPAGLWGDNGVRHRFFLPRPIYDTQGTFVLFAGEGEGGLRHGPTCAADRTCGPPPPVLRGAHAGGGGGVTCGGSRTCAPPPPLHRAGGARAYT